MNAKWKTKKGLRRQANRRAYLKRKAKAVSAGVKAYVQGAIDKSKEDRIAQSAIWNGNAGRGDDIPGSGINTATGVGLTTINSILPVIAKGTNDDNRNGNKIRAKALYVKYTINAKPLTSGTGTGNTNPDVSFRGTPFYVRVVIYRNRESPSLNSNNTLINNGGAPGGSSAWVVLQDLLQPYNKESFVILHSKTFKMCPARSETLDALGNVTGASILSVPNGTSQTIVKKCKIKLPKNLIYDDDVSTQPQNFKAYMAVGIINADGQGVMTTQYRARIVAESQLYFETM